MVSAVLLRFLGAAGLFALAGMFSIAGYCYLTNADELCQHFAQGAKKMPKFVRLLSPPRFLRSRYALWQLRSSGIAAVLMGCILAAIALLTLFTRQ